MDAKEMAAQMLEKTAKMLHLEAPKDFGRLARGELFILNLLHETEKPILPGELSAMMHISTARIAMALKTLEEKGWILREMDKNDRRKILVTITEAGRAHISEQRDRMHRRFAPLLEQLGEQDALEYLRIVDRIIEISEQHHDHD